ncbi:hypothetical protein COO60DRAFT_1489890 [Scenedesmus sp. NREL 46B-D3]|nr:hypothetical protein COO60DRAFT_1489890 [Scenedesmus sp. NREL 46B-D3]
MLEFRVRFSDEREVQVTVGASATFEEVAVKVRSARGWDNQQNVRFICSGQEMYMQDSVSRACCSVLHCIASDAASRHSCARQAGLKSDAHAQSVDWLEIVDPGIVLMWIFGSILGLLWLLFVFYAHMFDKTSVAMLCMMTVAFLIPCVLSYVPWLRMLTASPSMPVPRQQQQQQYYYSSTPETGDRQFAGTSAAHRGSGYGAGLQGAAAYGASAPPRPAARVRGPGAAAHGGRPGAGNGPS